MSVFWTVVIVIEASLHVSPFPANIRISRHGELLLPSRSQKTEEYAATGTEKDGRKSLEAPNACGRLSALRQRLERE